MKFECQSCEESCCSRITIALNATDVKRLAKTVDNIFDYISFKEGVPQGKIVKGNKKAGVLVLKQINGSCVFLKHNLCSIHKHRPMACRLYPCEPIFIEKPDGLLLRLRLDYQCSGYDKGERVNFSEISKQWKKERLAYDKLVDKFNKRKNRDLKAFVNEISG